MEEDPGSLPLAHPHCQVIEPHPHPRVRALQPGSAAARCPPTVLDLRGALEGGWGRPGVLMSGFIGGISPGPEHSWALEIQRREKKEH